MKEENLALELQMNQLMDQQPNANKRAKQATASLKKYKLALELKMQQILEQQQKAAKQSVIGMSEFGQKKENKIARIHEMGFSERNKVIHALKKWNWDELKAINWLVTH